MKKPEPKEEVPDTSIVNIKGFLLLATILGFAAICYVAVDSKGKFIESRVGLLSILFVALMFGLVGLFGKKK